MDKLLKDATIIYHNGQKENYDKISLTSQGIYTGELKQRALKDSSGLMEYRYIPFENIDRIVYINRNGKEKTRKIKDIRGELVKWERKYLEHL